MDIINESNDQSILWNLSFILKKYYQEKCKELVNRYKNEMSINLIFKIRQNSYQSNFSYKKIKIKHIFRI